MTMLMTSEGSV